MSGEEEGRKVRLRSLVEEQGSVLVENAARVLKLSERTITRYANEEDRLRLSGRGQEQRVEVV